MIITLSPKRKEGIVYQISKDDLEDIQVECENFIYYSNFLFKSYGASIDGLFKDINMYDLYTRTRTNIVSDIRKYKKNVYINKELFSSLFRNLTNNNLANIKLFDNNELFLTDRLSIINLLYYIDMHSDIIENAINSRINERYRRHTNNRWG